MLASLVTAANVHDTQAAGVLLDRAAQAGWRLERIEVDGIYVGARMSEAAARHGLDVQVTTRERDTVGFKPLPLRWRIVLPRAQDEGDVRHADQPLPPSHAQT